MRKRFYVGKHWQADKVIINFLFQVTLKSFIFAGLKFGGFKIECFLAGIEFGSYELRKFQIALTGFYF